MLTALFINAAVIILLIVSLIQDKQKTKKAFAIAFKTAKTLAPIVLSVILLIGLVYGLFSDTIAMLFGQESGLRGFLLISIIGGIIHLPALLAFPLAGSFLAEGASVSSVAAFITTLTMIGFVTLPLEIKTLGKNFALYRNLFSLIFALLIAALMGVLL